MKGSGEYYYRHKKLRGEKHDYLDNCTVTHNEKKTLSTKASRILPYVCWRKLEFRFQRPGDLKSFLIAPTHKVSGHTIKAAKKLRKKKQVGTFYKQ